MVIVWSISSNRRQRWQTSMISVRVLRRQKKHNCLFNNWLFICRLEDHKNTKHVNNLIGGVMSIHFVVFILIGFHCPTGRSIYSVTIVENSWLPISNLRRFFLDFSHFVISIKVRLVKVSVLCARVVLVRFLWGFLTVWHQEWCSISTSVTVPITARFSINMVKMTN